MTPLKQSERPLTVGARCADCNWTWKPARSATMNDVARASVHARQHRLRNPGHTTTVSGVERSSSANGTKINMLALEIER